MAAGLAFAPAASADPAGCLNSANLQFSDGAVMADKATSVRFVQFGADCTAGGSVTVTRPNGTVVKVPFGSYWPGTGGTATYSDGDIPVPVSDGAGIWKITALNYGTQSAPVSPAASVEVLRATKLIPDASPLYVASGQTPVLKGIAKVYAQDGAGVKLVPLGSGHTVFTTNPVKSAKTDAAGRYSITYPMQYSAIVGLRLQPSAPRPAPSNASVDVRIAGKPPENRCLQQATPRVSSIVALTDKPARVNLVLPWALCSDAALTVQKTDGTLRQKVALPTLQEHPDFLGTYGTFQVSLAVGASNWLITDVHQGAQSHKLATPVAFSVKRSSKVTASHTSAAILPGQSATIAGSATQYTASGAVVALANKVVAFRSGQTTLGYTRTNAYGRFSATVKPLGGYVDVVVNPGSTQVAYAFTTVALKLAPRPTTITGTAGPTAGGVIRPGSKMSTYGRLTVMFSSGKTGPFAGQKVLVQTRPKANPAAPYSTVASATTTSTGYYYANWNASVDADVRVVYVSPYSSIKSAYRWLRSIDVQ